MRKQEYKRDFDQNIWTIEVPGIEQDKIEVFQVKNVVYVRFNGEEHLQHLALDEKVETVRLELGILTIVIDRPDKRQDIPFS
jgi:HSP20 family molecular chaperone IbpA